MTNFRVVICQRVLERLPQFKFVKVPDPAKAVLNDLRSGVRPEDLPPEAFNHISDLDDRITTYDLTQKASAKIKKKTYSDNYISSVKGERKLYKRRKR